MAKMKLIYTSAERLNDLPIADGQIIWVPNDNMLCLDMHDYRFTYKTIRTFPTEEARLNDSFAQEGFYYVEATNLIWRKTANGTWRQVTSGEEPIINGETDEVFPSIGLNNTLSYPDHGIYNWKSQLNKYNLIANANTWENLE